MKTPMSLFFLVGSAMAHLRSHRKLVRAKERSLKIDQQYIIVFDESVEDVDSKLGSLMDGMPGASVLFTYKTDLKGASVTGVTEQFLGRLLDDPQVAFAEEDQEVRALQQTQTDPTWNLDRLDQSSLPLDNAYQYTSTGAGVQAYIIDSGIRSTHEDFAGRARCGFSAFGDDDNCSDGQGHGTHVAGIIGGTKFGVAKEVELVSVKVLDSDGAGRTSGVIAGIAYIVGQKYRNPTAPMVANLSLGGRSSSPALDTAINNAVATGIVFVVAAGNNGMNACWSSPASADKAIAVASINGADTRAVSSNYGACVDIFAPGESIASSWASNDQASETMFGTSFAAPHVSAVAALFLQMNPLWTPEEVYQTIQQDALRDVIVNPGRGSPNLLLNTERFTRDEENANEKTPDPSALPSAEPSEVPTGSPSITPSDSPTDVPTESPSTKQPSVVPTVSPSTGVPSTSPSVVPTNAPTKSPTFSPTNPPSDAPTKSPMAVPSNAPTPTHSPTQMPAQPTASPTSKSDNEQEGGEKCTENKERCDIHSECCSGYCSSFLHRCWQPPSTDPPTPAPTRTHEEPSCKRTLKACRHDRECCCGNCSFLHICWIW